MSTDVAVQDTAIHFNEYGDGSFAVVEHCRYIQKFHTEVTDIFKLPRRKLCQQDNYSKIIVEEFNIFKYILLLFAKFTLSIFKEK